MEQPPPRFGDWSSANRHLTAGGTVEGIPRENCYLPYIKQLMEKDEDNLCGKPHNNGEDTCLECEMIKHGE